MSAVHGVPPAAPPVLFASAGDTFGADSSGGNTSLTATDADGTRIVFTLRGPGVGTLAEGDGAIDFGLAFSGTTADSSVTLKVQRPGQDGAAFLNGVAVQGSLAGFSAKRVNLDGNLTVAGTLDKLVVNDVNLVAIQQHTIDIQGQGGTGDESVSMKFNALFDATIMSAIPIRGLTADDWSDDDLGGVPDSLTAPALTKLTLRGDPRQGDPGDLGADITLTDPASVLKAVAVKGWIVGAALRTAGIIGAVSADRIVDSTIFAGVAEAAESGALPDASELGSENIGSVTARGKRTAGLAAFVGSYVAAGNLGKIKLASVDPAHEGTPFGVAARTVNDYRRAGVRLRMADLAEPGDYDALTDYVLRVLAGA